MRNRKNIALLEDLRGSLSANQVRLFIYGCILYEKYTWNGRKAITERVARTLKDIEIDLIEQSIAQSNLDFEYDKVASKTFNNLYDEKERRKPTSDEDTAESLKRFVEAHKELFTDELLNSFK